MSTEHNNSNPTPATPTLTRRLKSLIIIPVVAVAALAFYGTIQLIQPTRNAAATAVTATSADRAKIEAIAEAARQYLRSQEFGKAEAVLREGVAKYPRDQSMHLLYGETLLTLGKAAEAYDHYQTGVLIGPDHPEYRFAAGTIASELQRWPDAEVHYTIAAQLDHNNPKYPLYLGQVERRLGKIDEARKYLADAVRLDPSLALGWGSLAAIAMDDGSLTAAKDYVARARKLDAKSNVWRLMEARILRRSNDPQTAAELLFAMPEEERLKDVLVLSELSMCLGLMGKPADAAAMYVKAAGLSPRDPEINYQAAMWLERTGDAAQSMTFLRAAALLGHKGALALVEAEAAK